MARGRRAPRRGTAPARRMRRGGRSTGVRKFEHGGSHCGPGMTMGEHGGCEGLWQHLHYGEIDAEDICEKIK